MAINPSDITTVRVDQLTPATIDLTKLIPIAETNGELGQSTIQALSAFLAGVIGSGSGVGYLPLSVTDGQQLPDVPAEPSFFLCGVGTFLNINGYADIICTEPLNAIMSLSDHWELAVQIPISANLGVQTVTGSAVDNTDPANPIINIQEPKVIDITYADLLALTVAQNIDRQATYIITDSSQNALGYGDRLRVFGCGLQADPTNNFLSTVGFYEGFNDGSGSGGTIGAWGTYDIVTDTFTPISGGGSNALVYKALLTQVGTDAPTAIVLENTLGFTPTWNRDEAGVYFTSEFFNSDTDFPEIENNIFDLDVEIRCQILPGNQISVISGIGGAYSDGRLNKTPITIYKY